MLILCQGLDEGEHVFVAHAQRLSTVGDTKEEVIESAPVPLLTQEDVELHPGGLDEDEVMEVVTEAVVELDIRELGGFDLLAVGCRTLCFVEMEVRDDIFKRWLVELLTKSVFLLEMDLDGLWLSVVQDVPVDGLIVADFLF